MEGARIVIGISAFWIIFSMLGAIFIPDEVLVDGSISKKGTTVNEVNVVSIAKGLFTLNIIGLPSEWSKAIGLFFYISIVIGIWVMLPFTGQ